MAAKKREPLTTERVLETAVRLADEVGIEALSMRKLGDALGVEAMSLYKHVANKEAVLDGIIDLVARELEAPTTRGNWKQAMRRRANSAHEVLLRHPWATMLMVSRVNIGPNMLNYVDATLGCLHHAGFTYPQANQAWNAIDNHVYGFTLQELNFPFKPSEYVDTAKAYLPILPAGAYPHLVELSRQLITGKHDGLHDFEFGLEFILDGLERVLKRKRR